MTRKSISNFLEALLSVPLTRKWWGATENSREQGRQVCIVSGLYLVATVKGRVSGPSWQFRDRSVDRSMTAGAFPLLYGTVPVWHTVETKLL
jgi:hypothetical protein